MPLLNMQGTDKRIRFHDLIYLINICNAVIFGGIDKTDMI